MWEGDWAHCACVIAHFANHIKAKAHPLGSRDQSEALDNNNGGRSFADFVHTSHSLFDDF